MPRFNLTVPDTIEDRLIEKLGLSTDQAALVKLLENRDARVTETARFKIAGGSFARDGVIPTDVDGVNATFSASAAANLELALYAPGAEVTLGELELPPLLESRVTQTLPDDAVACGLEIDARLEASVGAAGGQGWRFALDAAGEASARLAFFKELPSDTPARELAERTVGGFRTVFTLGRRPLEAGETVVAEYYGLLKLGASLDYGWDIRGTRKQGTGLEEVDLIGEYRADAKLAMSAGLRFERGVRVIVRPSEREGWVNVALHKQRESDASFAVNLSVDANIESRALRGGQDADVGAFLDALLGRTPLPDLLHGVEKLRDAADPQRVEELRDTLIRNVIGRVEGALEGPVADVQHVLDVVRGEIEDLVDAAERIDAEARRVVEELLERFPSLDAADDALARIERATSSETLLDGVVDDDTARRVREALDVLSKVVGKDLSSSSRLDGQLDDVRKLLNAYRSIPDELRRRFEEKYQAVKKQLHLDETMDRVKHFLDDDLSLEDLLAEKIAWLEDYLRQQLNRPVEKLADVATEVRAELTRLLDGYGDAVKKAKSALESALNRELGLQLGVAWRRLGEKQALVSFDLNLHEQAGRDALGGVMRGDLETVMKGRLTNAHAIRLRKSYLLDRLQGSLTVRAVVNGRESVRVRQWLASKESFIEATEDGEIWVQRGRAEESYRRRGRRAMVDVSTLFEVSAVEHFRREGRELHRVGAEVQGIPVRFQYRERLTDAKVKAAKVADRIREVLDSMSLQPVPRLGVNDLIGKIDALGRDAIGPVTIDVRFALSPGALTGVLSRLRSDAEARALAAASWDLAVATGFPRYPKVRDFYRANKERDDAMNRANGSDWHLEPPERNACIHLINTRERFQATFANIREHVFVQFRGEALKVGMHDLATIMDWIGGVKLEGMRDLITTVFAVMVSPSDRQGALVVTYTHPRTKETMEYRIDSRVGTSTAQPA